MSRFFNSWSDAMNTAINDAQASISGIIDLIGRSLALVERLVLFVSAIMTI